MTTVPVDRVRIFGRNSGEQLTEFSASVTRSWAIGQMGQASVELDTSKSYVTHRNLRFGNWLLVENNLLPSWVGVIDTPREWSANTVTVYAYSPEKLFETRTGPEEETVAGSSGKIFLRLLELLNEGQPTLVAQGRIWMGGGHRTETLNPNALDVDLKRIVERSGAEYRFRPDVTWKDGLVVRADWKKRLGDVTDYYLVHGSGGNLELLEQAMVEDGPVVNKAIAYGEGANWAERERVVAINKVSRRRYGLREEVLTDKKTEDRETLRNYARNYVKTYGHPVRRLSANALNVGSTFDYLRLGNVVNLVLKNTGFYYGLAGTETRARIIGMGYDPDQGHKVELVIEEVQDAE